MRIQLPVWPVPRSAAIADSGSVCEALREIEQGRLVGTDPIREPSLHRERPMHIRVRRTQICKRPRLLCHKLPALARLDLTRVKAAIRRRGRVRDDIGVLPYDGIADVHRQLRRLKCKVMNHHPMRLRGRLLRTRNTTEKRAGAYS